MNNKAKTRVEVKYDLSNDTTSLNRVANTE